MRYYILILTALLLSTVGFSQEKYVVTSKSNLNVRSSAYFSASVVGVLQSGQEITVVNSDNKDWAEVSFGNQRGFVSKKFIKPLSDVGSSGASVVTDRSFDLSFIDKLQYGSNKELVWVIIALIAIVHFFFKNNEGWISTILVFVAALLEIFYLIQNSAWDIITGSGFLWGVAIFIAFGYVLYMQIMVSITPIVGYLFGSRYSPWSRVFGFIIAIVASIVISIFYDDSPIFNFLPYIVVGSLGLQYLVSVVQGFKDGQPMIGLFLMPIATVIVVALILALLQYLSFVLAVVIVLFLLSGSSRRYVGSFTARDGTRYKVYE